MVAVSKGSLFLQLLFPLQQYTQNILVTGLATLSHNINLFSPKHLRVGINLQSREDTVADQNAEYHRHQKVQEDTDTDDNDLWHI